VGAGTWREGWPLTEVVGSFPGPHADVTETVTRQRRRAIFMNASLEQDGCRALKAHTVRSQTFQARTWEKALPEEK
jgi:hypothetical protein